MSIFKSIKLTAAVVAMSLTAAAVLADDPVPTPGKAKADTGSTVGKSDVPSTPGKSKGEVPSTPDKSKSDSYDTPVTGKGKYDSSSQYQGKGKDRAGELS